LETCFAQERSPERGSRILGPISFRFPSARGSDALGDGRVVRPSIHLIGSLEGLISIKWEATLELQEALHEGSF